MFALAELQGGGSRLEGTASSAIIGGACSTCTLPLARFTDAQFSPAQADAITNAVRLAAEHGDHVTSDQFKAGLAEVRTEIAEVRTEIAALDTRLSTQIANLDTRLSTQIAGVRTEVANLETRLIRWMVGTVLATGGLTFGILRFLG